MSPNFRPLKPRIRINPEYANLVSELSPEESESLKQSIKKANRLNVPIIVNQDGIILDGHHRYKACQDLGIEPETIVREFSDKSEEQLFVIDCNLTRRQLNNFQRAELALKSRSILTDIAKKNMSLGGKGSKDLETLDNKGVSGEIGKLAGVSHETVRKVQKILENKRIPDKTKEDLRLGKLSINEVYEMVEQDEEGQLLYQKYCKAADELKKSAAELDNPLERTKEEKERLKAEGEEKLRAEIVKPFRNYFEKRIEFDKAYAAFSFWIEYRENKNNDIESVASETLKEIVRLGIEDEMQTLPRHKIEQMLFHAVIENKVNINKIRNSKAIQAQLELLR